MKKILSVLFILGFCGNGHTVGKKTGKGGYYFPPDPNTFISQDVYQSTRVTLSAVTSTAATPDVATISIATSQNNIRPALLEAVIISSPGINSTLSIYDGRISTATADLIDILDTTGASTGGSSRRIPYHIGFSSSILFWNQGVVPAKINLIYLER